MLWLRAGQGTYVIYHFSATRPQVLVWTRASRDQQYQDGASPRPLNLPGPQLPDLTSGYEGNGCWEE